MSFGGRAEYLGLIWAVVFLPFQLIIMYIFWRRRGVQPIRARSPALVLVKDALLFIWLAVLCIQRFNESVWPCIATLWIGYFGLTLLGNIYLWRTWILFYDFRLTTERIKEAHSRSIKGSTTFRASWYLKNRYYVSHEFGVLTTCSSCITLCLPVGLITTTERDLTASVGDQCYYSWGGVLLGIYVGIYLLLFLGLAFKMKEVREDLWIKKELMFTGFFAGGLFIPWSIFHTAGRHVDDTIFPFSTVCLFCLGTCSHFLSTGYPLWLSRTTRKLNRTPSAAMKKELADLKTVLTVKEGVDALTEYLQTEFSVENLHFYHAVEAFRTAYERKWKEFEDRLGTQCSSPLLDDLAQETPLSKSQEEMKDDPKVVIIHPNPHLQAREAKYDSPTTATKMENTLWKLFEEILVDAQPIYAQYVVENASSQVNLPAEILKRIEAILTPNAIQLQRRLHASPISVSSVSSEGKTPNQPPSSSSSSSATPTTIVGGREPPNPLLFPNPLQEYFTESISRRMKGKIQKAIDAQTLELKKLYTFEELKAAVTGLVSVFNTAQKEIFDLMERDTMRRFFRSPQFERLKKKQQLEWDLYQNFEMKGNLVAQEPPSPTPELTPSTLEQKHTATTPKPPPPTKSRSLRIPRTPHYFHFKVEGGKTPTPITPSPNSTPQVPVATPRLSTPLPGSGGSTGSTPRPQTPRGQDPPSSSLFSSSFAHHSPAPTTSSTSVSTGSSSFAPPPLLGGVSSSTLSTSLPTTTPVSPPMTPPSHSSSPDQPTASPRRLGLSDTGAASSFSSSSFPSPSPSNRSLYKLSEHLLNASLTSSALQPGEGVGGNLDEEKEKEKLLIVTSSAS